MNAALAFFRQFLRHPKQVGSIIPSSRFLERRIVRAAGIAQAACVVELGPGTGGTTRALLAAMRPDARLLCIEINPQLAEMVRAIGDPRLTVHVGPAQSLPEALATHGLPSPDVVISGIPFSTMGQEAGLRVWHALRRVLPAGGRFVAYQFRGHVAEVDPAFPGSLRVEAELLNIPPMRVYRWEKHAG